MVRLVCSLVLVLVMVSNLQAENFGLGPVEPAGDTFLMASGLLAQQCTDLNRDGICDQTGVSLYQRTTTRQAILPQRQITRTVTRAAPIVTQAVVVPQQRVCVSQSVCPSGKHLRSYYSDGSYTIQTIQTTTMHHQSMSVGPEIHHGQRNAQGEIMYGSNEVNRLLRFRPILRRRLARMGQNEG